jgi:hypothetical protein
MGEGRYHRVGGTPTWYGSSSEAGAWAEFTRNPPAGVDLGSARRRMGRVTFEVLVLDLTDRSTLARLGITAGDLTSTDRRLCQELSAIAAEAGFEAVLGPSAAAPGETTLAVFGPAITDNVSRVDDLGVRMAPGMSE